ncbi:PTS system mannose/fructose/sorbose family transporter subunit IID [Lactobacillus kullabergensis]|uniref:PTS mannose transporter subunit IID n=1 Tax=Lactobacillus kullabergensis TaxID=1218493 RepID=A0ABM6W3J8_9LACO|nr:PTS system mannose/fructose/sorbose family transporter subunit IID [Lactobacillus kullabergensis]AWM76277.1 PTS mannose transporter subunit IID [Lactobacillus kullabergensis]
MSKIAGTKKENSTSKFYKIQNKDIKQIWFRWFFSNAISHSFSRYLGPAFLWAIRPLIDKLYPNKEQRKAAYERHNMFYNTQVSWGGGTIIGITASLEQKRAEALAENKIDEANQLTDLIINTKTGLMGALAGVGDSIDSGTVLYIFIAICLPWAQKGMAIGAIVPFVLMALYQSLMGLYFTHLGFGLGRSAATQLVGSKKMKGLIDGLSILGLFMMGVLGAQFVTVKSILKFSISGKSFVLQNILNQILPGLLPLLVIGLVYLYFVKHGMKVTRALVGLTILLGVLAALGIL